MSDLVTQFRCPRCGHEWSEAIPPHLTPRQFDTLRLLALGKDNHQIAEELGIEVGTVKSHLEAIFGELQVQNRVAAVVRAQRLGLVEMPSEETK